MADKLLEVSGLKKYFKTAKGMLHAVDDVSFSIERGKTLGIVGESGCGKSTTGRCVLRLIEPSEGSIRFEGKEVKSMKSKERQAFCSEMQMIFQDPYASLNPRKTVGELIADPLRCNRKDLSRKDREKKVMELMNTVGLAERLYNTYPHELDGGRRQRIGIARALAVDPKFIVCDEPVSALDVSIQAQILNLLRDLQKERGLTYIFITHDLSVVNYFSDDIAVMYLGKIVEKAPSAGLFDKPLHPYTQALLSAIPIPDIDVQTKRILLKGELSSPIDPKPGCRFATRCVYAKEECFKVDPELKEVEQDHFVACHLCK